MQAARLPHNARRSAAIMLLACFVGFTTPACTSCESIAWAGLTVRVFDEKTGEQMCGVRVSATDGAHSEVLLDSSGTSDCSYSGATERPGTYRIAVSKEGYVTKTIDDVVVSTEDQCGHVEPQLIEVALVAEQE